MEVRVAENWGEPLSEDERAALTECFFSPGVGEIRDTGHRRLGFQCSMGPSTERSTLHGAVEVGKGEINETDSCTQPGF